MRSFPSITTSQPSFVMPASSVSTWKNCRASWLQLIDSARARRLDLKTLDLDTRLKPRNLANPQLNTWSNRSRAILLFWSLHPNYELHFPVGATRSRLVTSLPKARSVVRLGFRFDLIAMYACSQVETDTITHQSNIHQLTAMVATCHHSRAASGCIVRRPIRADHRAPSTHRCRKSSVSVCE